MRNENNGQRGNKTYLKAAAAALVISGLGAGIFGMAASVAADTELGSMQKVPTDYQVSEARTEPDVIDVEYRTYSYTPDEVSGNAVMPQGVATVQYKVMKSERYKETPTGIALSMEEAAAIGVKHLEDVFYFDKDGANVYMQYSSGTETFPRAYWIGYVCFGEEDSDEDGMGGFRIDAVTGELFSVGRGETLDVDVPLGYDISLEKNHAVYAEAAKEVVERCNLVGSKVASVEYGSQGYGGNNPVIMMNVYGENGQMAIIEFSRYNQKLLSVMTHASNVIMDKATKELIESGKYESAVLNAE